MMNSKFIKVIRYFSNRDLFIYFFHNLNRFFYLRESPIIVCGCPRSGTTLLMAMLDSHPEIHVIPFETAVLQRRSLEKRLFKSDYFHFLFTRLQLLSYLFSSKIKSTAVRWCEKTPLNILNVEEIRRVLKNKVIFINIIRDGRDVVSSYHQRLGFMVSPELWKSCIEEADRNLKSPDFISIRYEDLISDPNTVLCNLQEFLNLRRPFSIDEWMTATRISENKSIVNGNAMVYSLSELTNKSIGKWRRSSSPRLREFLSSKEYSDVNARLGYV